MRKPVVLTNRILTPEELGERLGMSPSHVAWIRRLADKLIAERENGGGRRVSTKNARRASTTARKKRAVKTNRKEK
jgi:Mn-dependent DtxR family transcriptional regulator